MRYKLFGRSWRSAVTAYLILALTVAHGVTQAQEESAPDSGASLRAATQNPISSMYSLPFKFTFDNGATNGDANFLNIQFVRIWAVRSD